MSGKYTFLLVMCQCHLRTESVFLLTRLFEAFMLSALLEFKCIILSALLEFKCVIQTALLTRQL